MDPPCACQWTPPPFERRNMAPLANSPPPLERRNMARAIDTGGGGGSCPMLQSPESRVQFPLCVIFLASLFWSFLCLHVTPRIVFGFFLFWSGLCPHVTPSGYPPTAIGYPPTAIVGRIGHSELFFSFITAPPASVCVCQLPIAPPWGWSAVL